MKYRLALIAVLAIGLTACGFHLRGMVDIPSWLKNIAIIVEKANQELSPLLKSELDAYRIPVTEPNSASFLLFIERDILQKDMSNVSSGTTPRQYQLSYTVYVKLTDAKGRELITTHSVSSTRQVTINGDNILGSNEEEALLISEMRRDTVIQIINRLASLKRNPYVN